jgi:hypothetical protein
MIDLSNPAHLFVCAFIGAIPVVCAIAKDFHKDTSAEYAVFQGTFAIYTFFLGLTMFISFISMIAKLWK